MTKQTLEYCARAVIQHLNGDMGEFNRYRNIALMIYHQEHYVIGDIIPADTRRKLYEMVS